MSRSDEAIGCIGGCCVAFMVLCFMAYSYYSKDIELITTYLISPPEDAKLVQSQKMQAKKIQAAQSVRASKNNQQTNKAVVKEENNKKEPAQPQEMQVKQTLSESDKGFYAVVTRSVEIHKNDQITHEVELDKDGDGKPDFQAQFNGRAFLSLGQKVNLTSLMKHSSFKYFLALERQKENF